MVKRDLTNSFQLDEEKKREVLFRNLISYNANSSSNKTKKPKQKQKLEGEREY